MNNVERFPIYDKVKAFERASSGQRQKQGPKHSRESIDPAVRIIGIKPVYIHRIRCSDNSKSTGSL